MPFKFSFEGTDVKVVDSFRKKIDFLGPALVEKMTALMTKLQAKARAGTKVAMVRESIRDPRARVEGNMIIGELTWGGEPTTTSYKGGKPYDIAQIFEYGSKTHAINPLTQAGTRAHEKGAARRVGKDVLYFILGGKDVFAKYAFPKGIVAEHFMENAVDSMKQEFAQEILNTIRGVMRQ